MRQSLCTFLCLSSSSGVNSLSDASLTVLANYIVEPLRQDFSVVLVLLLQVLDQLPDPRLVQVLLNALAKTGAQITDQTANHIHELLKTKLDSHRTYKF